MFYIKIVLVFFAITILALILSLPPRYDTGTKITDWGDGIYQVEYHGSCWFVYKDKATKDCTIRELKELIRTI